MALMNKDTLNKEELKLAFEQYKLYVEMADKISERRGHANTFFTTVNTLLFTVATFIGSNDLVWTIFINMQKTRVKNQFPSKYKQMVLLVPRLQSGLQTIPKSLILLTRLQGIAELAFPLPILQQMGMFPHVIWRSLGMIEII